jgi:hypothetical protein
LFRRAPSAANRRNQRAIDAFFEGLDEEANDLAERLVNGDDEAVWAWFRQRYPKATSRVSKERQWREFVTAIREYCADEAPLAASASQSPRPRQP